MPSGIVRARRTGAVARATMAASALVLVIAWPPAGVSVALASVGFSIILGSAAVQLALPRTEWTQLEESVASIAAVLVIGLGPDRVTPLTLLWLTAVASGVLARGGRAHWVGRALLLVSLALPIALHRDWNPPYAFLCLAAIALLLTCGRVTQELRAMLDQARHDADHDGLTGLLNRSAFRDRLEQAAHDAVSGRARSVALLLVDLDNFGAINKTAGHAAGDALLRAVVARLRRGLGPEAVLGRLGGDEFAAIVTDEDPLALAGELLLDLGTEDEAAGGVRASAGIVHAPRDGDSADALLRAVDVALRVAKRSGRHQASEYAGEPFSDDGPGGARAALERLIAGEGLRIVVQPVVLVPARRVVGYEALARFDAGTTPSPLHWFALADELGVRDRLELACMRAALQWLPRRPPDTALSVNLSGPLLLDARTAELLERAGELRGLVIELTENTLVEDTPGLHAELDRLRGLGVRFAVDDMGAGYSGLRQLTTLRPTYLKLDRWMISGIDRDPDRGALVAALLAYARQTGGRVIAEGVETEAELETLVALGVELIQGFLLGRPGDPWPQLSESANRAPSAPRARSLPARA